MFFQTGLQRLYSCINKRHHVFSCFQMRSSLSSVIFHQQYQPTELLRQVNVFTAIISVILLSLLSFSKYLRFLASNAIYKTPYPWRHNLLSFPSASSLCPEFKKLRRHTRFQDRSPGNDNLLKIIVNGKMYGSKPFPGSNIFPLCSFPNRIFQADGTPIISLLKEK